MNADDRIKQRLIERQQEIRQAQEQADQCVNAWFWQWQEFHCDINPRSDWLDADSGHRFWSHWRQQFVLNGLHDLEVAIEASERVSLLELKHQADHLRKLLDASKTIYAERRDRVGTGLGQNIDAAREASKAMNCPDCAGASGFAWRYLHRKPVPGEGRYQVYYCLCPLGRATRANHAANKDANLKGRIMDLADFPQLHRGPVSWSAVPDNRFCYPMESWDQERREPRPMDLAGLKAMVASATTSVRDVLRQEAKPRSPYTLNQREFLGMLGSLRPAFDSLHGDERGAILANFKDDTKPLDRDMVDREVRRVSALAYRDPVAATQLPAGEAVPDAV